MYHSIIKPIIGQTAESASRPKAQAVASSLLERVRYALLDTPPVLRDEVVHELEWAAIFCMEDRVHQAEGR
jgi:hypothetical protein